MSTDNQRKALECLLKNRGKPVSIDDIAVAVYGKHKSLWPKAWRKSLMLTMLGLRVKTMEEGGEQIKRVSKLGRAFIAKYQIG